MSKIGADYGHDVKKDPGAVSGINEAIGDYIYTKEADITFIIGERFSGILQACGHEVVKTRNRDTKDFISLPMRSGIINNAKCVASLSIHLNSSVSRSAKYISTFVQPGSASGRRLAAYMQPELVKASKWPDGGIREENLHMCREMHMPACLVELGFVSNIEEEKQLNTDVVQRKIAAGLAKGMLNFLGPIESWQMALVALSVDLDAAHAEIRRSGEVYQLRRDNSDLIGANKAHLWANQVRQAIGEPTT